MNIEPKLILAILALVCSTIAIVIFIALMRRRKVGWYVVPIEEFTQNYGVDYKNARYMGTSHPMTGPGEIAMWWNGHKWSRSPTEAEEPHG